MTNKEASKVLEHIKFNENYELYIDKEDVEAITLAIKALERSEWIPCSERLPEDMQKVLVWFEYYRYGRYGDFNCMHQTYGFGYVCDGKWSSFINGETGWQDARILAWMPLPEPYKEASHET